MTTLYMLQLCTSLFLLEEVASGTLSPPHGLIRVTLVRRAHSWVRVHLTCTLFPVMGVSTEKWDSCKRSKSYFCDISSRLAGTLSDAAVFKFLRIWPTLHKLILRVYHRMKAIDSALFSWTRYLQCIYRLWTIPLTKACKLRCCVSRMRPAVSFRRAIWYT